MEKYDPTYLIIAIVCLVISLTVVGICLFNMLRKDKTKCKKPYKTLAIFSFIFVVDIPFLINELYKKGGVYETMWGADAVLAFYGSFLAFIGTVSLGALALWQNKKANEINMRILKLEEINNVPFLHIDVSNSCINSITAHELDIIIALRNKSNGIINISEVSDIKYDLFLISQNNILPFCKGWTKYYTIVPDQIIPINFFKQTKVIESPIIDKFDEIEEVKFFQMQCNFDVTIHFVNSKEKYKQHYELILNCFKKVNDKKFIMSIDNIENYIVIQEETKNDLQ